MDHLKASKPYISLLEIMIERYPLESQKISSLLGSARAGQLVIWGRWPEGPGCYALFHARDFHDYNWSGHPKAGPRQNTWNMKSCMHMSMHCRISLTSDPPKKCWASDNCGAALATMVKLVGGRITIIPDIVLPGLRAKIILKKGKATGWLKLAGNLPLLCLDPNITVLPGLNSSTTFQGRNSKLWEDVRSSGGKT